jgi:hypothetical protein
MSAVAAKLAKNGNGRVTYEDLSIKAIATRCGLDRATTKKRLDENNYSPIEEQAKLKLYRFDAEMEAVLTETRDKLTDVRIRKEQAMAKKIELQNAEIEGELASVAEFVDTIQKVFGNLHKEIAIRMPRRLAARLAKAKTSSDVNKILTNDVNGIFKVLAEDFEKYLGKGQNRER